ncbi:MAG: hypothetical protein WBW62_12935 [Solirubrobacterales bacterium]
MPNFKLTLSEHSDRKILGALFGTVALIAVALLVVMSAPGDSEAASKRFITLGESTKNLTPNCGMAATDRTCTAEGRITGYQVKATGSSRDRGFVVPWAGKVVSWSISLSNPTTKDTDEAGPAQLPAYNNYFGSPAQARISVLKRVQKKKKGDPRYKMVRQSPVQILNPHFGTKVTFALTKPLNVIKNQIVALTIPTWAPAFWKPRSCDLSNGTVIDEAACARSAQNNTWRGSRASGKCSLGNPAVDSQEQIAENIAGSYPQQKVDSVKKYGCYYGGNVLLYTANVVGQ